MNIDEAMVRIQQQNSLLEQQRLQLEERAGSITSEADKEKLQKACQEFEAIFLNMMLKQMRGSVMEGEFTEKSHAREIFEEMHDEELSKAISQGKGMGLAQQLYQQLTATTVKPAQTPETVEVQPQVPTRNKPDEG